MRQKGLEEYLVSVIDKLVAEASLEDFTYVKDGHWITRYTYKRGDVVVTFTKTLGPDNTYSLDNVVLTASNVKVTALSACSLDKTLAQNLFNRFLVLERIEDLNKFEKELNTLKDALDNG